jgi:hypothetical protein
MISFVVRPTFFWRNDMSSNLDPSVHARAQQAAAGLKAKLEQLILGRTLPSWRCRCGVLGHGDSVAIEVCPAGDRYQYQIAIWDLWRVKMRYVNAPADSEYSYSIGLGAFVEPDLLKVMFMSHFAGIDVPLK